MTSQRRLSILPFQPLPVSTHVCRMEVGGQVVTAIGRTWNPGDPQRCRLCPVSGCIVKNDACVKLVDRHVSTEDAPLFDTTRLKRVDRPSDRPASMQ